ncbi:30S ribosomal protein S1 [Candidatus Absconditicoccus praedator]|uniref:30S ribosomal protein S1 n=1 Tax=Candidatus Absconditicoccus praedator TaxID=2735562 RepID=UPI001E3F7913|nr:S1 RNA-binding domain-containing protein [Candidatus Absconditicoccus praedator]UFX83146.1 S1 RNA-binding domain-containing protein [Candidatus Absconditicoccus praedator]
MDLQNFLNGVQNETVTVPKIKEGKKTKGTVIKKIEKGVLVSCQDDTFTGLILPKEAKDLERNGVDLSPGTELEAEIINLDTMDDEGYFVISISKLIQYDVWNSILEKTKKDETITVVPSEANLGGLLVDMHGIKGFIPLSQLAPVNYPRVEDGDQEKIFEQLLDLMGKEFQVRIINIDEDGKRLILSEREALREEKDKIMQDLDIGKEYEGTISGVSSYGLFVTIGGGIEGLVHVSEITYGHVDNIERFGNIGDKVNVKVIGYEDGKISLSMKKLKGDPWKIIPQKFQIGDIVEGEVIRFVPYGVFIRVYDDINGLIHLSEITGKAVSNPAEIVKPGQKVKAKIILMDPDKRKMGLSMKALEEEKEGKSRSSKSTSAKEQKSEKVVVKKKKDQ